MWAREPRWSFRYSRCEIRVGGLFEREGTGVNGHFRIAEEGEQDQQSWGLRRWISHPPSTGATRFAAVEVTLAPGQAHTFHRHPGQEEVIYVLAGEVEQWIDREKRNLRTGDAVFIPVGMVHGSFNVGQSDAKLFVTIGPCVGGDGTAVVDVADEEPWKSLRP
jgi:quercetin dioxygenase-like cupin family protein